MDRLFTPWRFAYVSSLRSADEGCVLCELAAANPDQDERRFILQRTDHHYIVLNIYPYNCGHIMIVPYAHVPRLSDLSRDALHEMIRLASRAETALEEVYHAHGVNIGLNLGRHAGAGIADHIHMHAVPRWTGDTNFETVIGETRVIPEDLHESWRKLRGRF